MRSLKAILHRLRGSFRRRALEREMKAEMEAHLDGLTERNLAAGMTPKEARFAALREFGGVAQIQEHARAARSLVGIENVMRDVGFAVRTLRKNPGFTAVVVLTLVLGLGVNTALFTWFNAAAFRPLPVSQPEQLFMLMRLDANGSETKAMSYTDFVAYRDHQTVLSGLAAASGQSVELADAAEFSATTGVQPTELGVETVSTNYFAVFGVPMALGRALVPADENSTGALPVIVLSHRFWENYCAADPNVIGRTIRLRGLTNETLTIVGVTGPEFYGTRPGALAGWVPSLMRPGDAWRTNMDATNYTLTGRLRPGVSWQDAAGELQIIANEFLVRTHRGPVSSETIVLTSASTYLKITTKMLGVLLPMVGLFGAVFLVSCANASNLILARTVTRQFELAVRSALGASRRRLFTLLMTECLLLGALGGLAGWGVAAALLQFAWPWLLNMIPGAREGTAGLYLHADYRVFTFTLIVSILAGAAGGFFPALHVTRRNIISALNNEGSAFGRGLRLSRIRSVLAIGQLALSSALLFTAGLLVHRALIARFADVGFDQSRVLTFEVLAPRTYQPAQLDSARRKVLEQLRALPEVAAICEMPRFPFAQQSATVFIPAGDKLGGRAAYVLHASVPATYFATLQLPLIRGRSFGVNETPGDHVAVISETAAREFWPGGNALGQSFDVPTSILTEGEAPAPALTNDANVPRTSITVIGIARDTRVYDPWSGDRPVIFLPLAPRTNAAPYLLIRTSREIDVTSAALQQVGRQVAGIAPRILTVKDLFAQVFIQYRIVAWVAGILAGISLIVAVIGLYGLMSFAVNQRVKEIGIRIALGATPRRVASEIILESLRLVAVGGAAGYGLSVLISLVARTLLFGVSAFDPLACAVVVVFLGAIGLFACWMPARRASKVDPIVALRAE